jgi:hypothetical protein
MAEEGAKKFRLGMVGGGSGAHCVRLLRTT